MNSTLRGGIAVATLALILSGCAGPVQPSEPVETGGLELAAGVCIDDSITSVNGGTDADLGALVPCTEPHLYAVVAVLPVDAQLYALGDTAEEIARGRTELQTDGTLVRQTFLDQATRECRSALSDVVGLGDLTLADGTDATEAAVSPAGAFYLDITMTTEDEWVAGDPRFVCSTAWTDPADPATQARVAFDEGVTLADWFTPKIPSQTRSCVYYGETESAPVSCDDAHWVENVFVFDAEPVLGDDRVAGMRTTAVEQGEVLPSELLDELDAVCAEAWPVVLGSATNEALSSRAQLGTAGWWAETSLVSYHEMVCGIGAADSLGYDLVGTVVGTAQAQPEVVAAG